MSERLEEIMKEYFELKAKADALKAKMDELRKEAEAELKALGTDRYKGEAGIVSLKTRRNIYFDKKKFQREHPELFERYTSVKVTNYVEFKR